MSNPITIKDKIDETIFRWIDGTKVPGAMVVTGDLADQIIQLIKDEVIGKDEITTQTSPDDDYERYDMERDYMNRRNYLRATQRAKLEEQR